MEATGQTAQGAEELSEARQAWSETPAGTTPAEKMEPPPRAAVSSKAESSDEQSAHEILAGDQPAREGDTLSPDGQGPDGSSEPEYEHRLAQERQRILQQEQQNAGRYQSAWHQERNLRMLRERQVQSLLQQLASGKRDPETVERIEQEARRLQERYARAAVAEPKQAPYLFDPSEAAHRSALSNGPDKVTSGVPAAEDGLFGALRSEVEALGLDPGDPAFEDWSFQGGPDGLRKAVRAIGRLADAKAQRAASEARKRAIEETKEKFGINSADTGGGYGGWGDPSLTPERVLGDAGF